MRFSGLDGWAPTRDALHGAAQVVGAVNVAVSAPQPNELEYSLWVQDAAVGTGPQPGLGGGALELDLAAATVRYRRDGESRFSLPVAGISQVALADAVVAALADEGVVVRPARKKIVHEAPAAVDGAHAAGWAQVATVAYEALSAFRADVAAGLATPVVLWPHHFDLAFLRFVGPGTDVHQDPQLALGLASESEGIPMPYLYAYGWPMPEGIAETPAPGATRWHTEGWTGLLLPWEALVASADPAGLLAETLRQVWAVMAPALGIREPLAPE